MGVCWFVVLFLPLPSSANISSVPSSNKWHLLVLRPSSASYQHLFSSKPIHLDPIHAINNAFSLRLTYARPSEIHVPFTHQTPAPELPQIQCRMIDLDHAEDRQRRTERTAVWTTPTLSALARLSWPKSSTQL